MPFPKDQVFFVFLFSNFLCKICLLRNLSQGDKVQFHKKMKIHISGVFQPILTFLELFGNGFIFGISRCKSQFNDFITLKSYIRLLKSKFSLSLADHMKLSMDVVSCLTLKTQQSWHVKKHFVTLSEKNERGSFVF